MIPPLHYSPIFVMFNFSHTCGSVSEISIPFLGSVRLSQYIAFITSTKLSNTLYFLVWQLSP